MEWITLEKLAEEFAKDRATIFRWCTEGFILTLGYHVRRDCRGRWFVSKNPVLPENQDSMQQTQQVQQTQQTHT